MNQPRELLARERPDFYDELKPGRADAVQQRRIAWFPGVFGDGAWRQKVQEPARPRVLRSCLEPAEGSHNRGGGARGVGEAHSSGEAA